MRTVFITLITLCSFLTNGYCQDKKAKEVSKNVTTEDAEESEESEEPIEKTEKSKVKQNNSNVNLGLEGGLIFSSLNVDGYNSSSKSGLRSGGVLEYQISKRMHIQHGIYYAINGGKDVHFEGSSNKYNVRVSSLEIPINTLYKFGLSGKNHIFFGLGLCYSYNLSGNINPGKVDLEIGSDSNDQLKSSNLSLNFNLGYEMASGLFFRLNILPGILDMQPQPFKPSILSSSFGLQIGYFFVRRNN